MKLSIAIKVNRSEYKALKKGTLDCSDVVINSLSMLYPDESDKFRAYITNLLSKEVNLINGNFLKEWYVKYSLFIKGSVNFTFDVSLSEEMLTELLTVTSSTLQDSSLMINAYFNFIKCASVTKMSERTKKNIKTLINTFNAKEEVQ